MRILIGISLLAIALSLTPLSVEATNHDREQLEYLGLAGHGLTSLRVYFDIVAVGSDGSGVYWQIAENLPGAGWELAGLQGHNVRTVYPHKSGPIGWAIGAGVRPPIGETVFIYCNCMGQGFEPLSDGIDPDLTGQVTDLNGFPDPSICGETYAAGGRSLYRRDFYSPLWEPLYIASIEGSFFALQTHEDAPGLVLAGGGEGFAGMFFLLKSLDFGDTWEELYPPGYVWDVDFAGESAETIFVAAGSEILRSLDGGENWQTVLTADPSTGDILREIVIATDRERVYAAGPSWSGEAPLYASDDWGATWERIATDLPGAIMELDLTSDETLLIAHREAGVFRLAADLTGQDQIPPRAVILYQNHPNPFNPRTTIRFVLAETQHAEVSIVNLAGDLVTVLARGRYEPGTHATTWNGRDDNGRAVAAGVYLIRLETGTGVEAKKALLVR